MQHVDYQNSRLLQIIAFYDFVYFVFVVSRQFISFVTKMEVVAKITSSRLVFTSLLRVWGRVDLVITVNTSSRSQWNAAEAHNLAARIFKNRLDNFWQSQDLAYIFLK